MQKIVLITGATSGIGRRTAEFLAEKGYKVYGTGRNPQEKSDKIHFLPMDIRNEAEIQTQVRFIIEKEGRIDILINNAGVGISGAMEELPSEAIKNTFQTNFFGVIDLIKAVLPTMRSQKKGLIINVTSIAGYMGLPFRGVYSASKGALALASETLRMELKPFNIEVVCVAPGDVATDIASRRYHAPLLENSPYKNIYEASLSLMNEDVNNGQNPLQMAQLIHQIIEEKRPKVHYKAATFLQKFSIVLKRILPSKWYEKLLMNHYKIS